MTVAVAHRYGWIVADSRGTEGPQVVPARYKKVLRVGDHTLIAIAGQASALLDLATLIPDAAENIEVAPAVFATFLSERQGTGKENYCDIVLVNKRQELYLMDGAGSCVNLMPDCKFYAIGSGRDETLGYLRALEARNGDITPEDAVEAISSCAKLNFTVGGPCQTETLHH